MDAVRQVIGKVVSSTPHECPLHAYTDPLVARVLSLYSARESNMLEAMTGGWDQMSRRDVEGVRLFDRSYRAARAHFRRLDEERNERERKKAAMTSAGRRR